MMLLTSYRINKSLGIPTMFLLLITVMIYCSNVMVVMGFTTVKQVKNIKSIPHCELFQQHTSLLWNKKSPNEEVVTSLYQQQHQQHHQRDSTSNTVKSLFTNTLSMLVITSFFLWIPFVSFATAVDDSGASSAANAKLTTGGASTLQSGRTISITRGVNLDNSNFANQNLKGVAFQQSVVRDADFSNSNLSGASFFDATVDGSNFNNADMTLANIEMAQFNRATMKNTIAREMYVSGATLFQGIMDIENSDWTDTYLRADQQKYLCNHPTAKGVNPITGVNTRESLMCKD